MIRSNLCRVFNYLVKLLTDTPEEKSKDKEIDYETKAWGKQ